MTILLVFILATLCAHIDSTTVKARTHTNGSLADRLHNEIKILCLVLTWPRNHQTKAKAVKETWGKRCNKVVFISSTRDTTLPTVRVHVKEGKKYLWPKIKKAFTYAYKHYYKKYDWFVKADDDT